MATDRSSHRRPPGSDGPPRLRSVLAPRLPILARGLALGVALAHLGLLAWIVASRLAYPADLEWMEGGTLVEAWRVSRGLGLYVAPSADFIPFPYTPLYPLAVGWLARFTGLPVGYPLARAVSAGAFGGSLLVLFLALRRRGAQRQEAWIAAGAVAAVFPATGGWFDLARVDSLSLALVIAGAAILLVRGGRPSGALVAGALLALAFFAKQTALVFVAAGGLALVLDPARRGARQIGAYAAGALAVLGGGMALLDARSGGWLRFYVFDVLGRHQIHPERLAGEAWFHMLTWQPVVLALLAAALFEAWRAGTGTGDLRFWGVFAAAGMAASAVNASIHWAYANTYLPGLVLPAAALGAALPALRRTGQAGQCHGSPATRAAGASLVALALAGQLAWRLYDPRPFVPTAAQRTAATSLTARIAAVPGEVLVPSHPFLAVQAGHAPAFHRMALGALREGGRPTPPDLPRGLAAGRWAAVIADRPPDRRDTAFRQGYKLQAFLAPGESPEMVTGYPTRPGYVFVPRRAEPDPPGSLALADFEAGSWAGWEVAGVAFGPRPAAGAVDWQQPVGPFQGRFLANSGHGTGEARGRVLSPEFTLGRPRLTFLIGGGQRPEELKAELLVGGRAVRWATGTGSRALSTGSWEVADLVGQRGRLALVDEATGPDGYLLFDDLRGWEESGSWRAAALGLTREAARRTPPPPRPPLPPPRR